MSILGIIPARGGSKGIKRKNLKILGEKSLLEHTIHAAINSNIEKLIVSTDDQEIASISKKLGVLVPFLRPKELAGDNSNSIDVAIHGLIQMEKITNSFFESIIYLQPTTPFRSSTDINNCLDIINEQNNIDSVISVVNVGSYHPARMKFIKGGLLIDPDFCEAKENQNRQELRPMFIRNGAIYLTKRETLLSGSFKGRSSFAYEMPYHRSINIDSNQDLDFAKWQLIKNKS
mgnify:CR=1 FL=1|tara:strand:- start:365 stop:1060 length:696 start_codon:yes stop_codon:yes gene_type:complete